MLRRAAATAALDGGAAAWFRRLTRGLMTLPPAHLGRRDPQAQLRPPRAVSAPPPRLPQLCGARGYSYRRMARRIPTARPDGYSTSDGEEEEPDAREAWETTEPVGEGDDDSEGSEVEGFMMDFGALSGDGDGDGDGNDDEKGTEEGGK